MIVQQQMWYTAQILDHMSRNPRVLSYRKLPSNPDNVLVVRYDTSINIPAAISLEAWKLGLKELSMREPCAEEGDDL